MQLQKEEECEKGAGLFMGQKKNGEFATILFCCCARTLLWFSDRGGVKRGDDDALPLFTPVKETNAFYRSIVNKGLQLEGEERPLQKSKTEAICMVEYRSTA